MADRIVIRREIFWGMSEEAIREAVAQTAMSLLGIREGTKEFEEQIRKVYNSLKPLPVGYQLSKKDAWCAAFVTVVGMMLEISGVILPECSCSRMIEKYRKAGRWMEADDYDADIGDILMWDWQDSGKGDNTGAPDHTGILVAKDGDEWVVCEGNYDNQVKLRTLRRDQIRIRGWCLPDYAALVHGYRDVPKDAWFRRAVEWAEGKDIVEGIGEGDFAPDMGCTRGQLVTMLWRLSGEPEAGEGHPFLDVKENAFFAKAVRWAEETGITEGMADDVFDPYGFCTRAQIVTMIWRWKGRELAENVNHPFEDAAGEKWYSDAVEWAWCKGITIGVTGTAFEPFRGCTRAQVVTMLHRLETGR